MKRSHLIFALIFLASLPVKLYAAQDLVWDIDYVPVISIGHDFLQHGTLPVHGTLSSVAAYNMPFLVWLQIPVMFFTQDVPSILIITQLLWNLLGTWFIYRLGAKMFSDRVGLTAATLFTFSEAGISSAYTAWAQLLLPTFFVIVIYCLYQWQTTSRERYIALALAMATAAFMTHFAAITLFPVIVLWALLPRTKFGWRGIFAGVILSGLLLLPYLSFQASRNFVDLQAFLTRQTTVPAEIMEQYNYLKPGYVPPGQDDESRIFQLVSTDLVQADFAQADDDISNEPSRVERALNWVVSIPVQIVEAFMLAFGFLPRSLEQYAPIAYIGSVVFAVILAVIMWWVMIVAVFRSLISSIHQWRKHKEQTLRNRYAITTSELINTESGRLSLLVISLLVIIGALILVRAGPREQPSYYTGIFSIQVIFIAYGINRLIDRFVAHSNWRIAILTSVLIVFALLQSADRYIRIRERDITQFTSFNVWRYDAIEKATDWIAENWRGENSEITVSYDIMPEANNLWWVAPWNTVNPDYRIGMSYDYLLSAYHRLENTNLNPIGIAEDPDYIIVFEPGLSRYPIDAYRIEQFDAIYVLKPNED